MPPFRSCAIEQQVLRYAQDDKRVFERLLAILAFYFDWSSIGVGRWMVLVFGDREFLGGLRVMGDYVWL